MRYADALPAFRQYLEAAGLTAEDLDAQAAVTAMLGFYADERATDVDLDTDGDMLLFQWGTYGWHQGPGPAFEYNITRQLAIELDRRAPGHGVLCRPPSAPGLARLGTRYER